MQETVKQPPQNVPAGPDYRIVGTRPIRPDGVDKVTGRAKFGADYNLPGQLTGLTGAADWRLTPAEVEEVAAFLKSNPG